MKKVLEFQSPRQHYQPDACVVWCFDDRFFKLLKLFGKQQGFRSIDLIKIAGGAQALANGPSAGRDFVLDQIKKSIALHEPKRFALMLHQDCGAYGGSSKFADLNAEFEHHQAQLASAKRFLLSEIPGIAVECYVAGFDCLYEVCMEDSLEEAVAAA